MNTDSPSKNPWKLTHSEQGPDLIIFKARFDWFTNPRNEKTVKAVVLDSPDWANVVAITPEQKIIVVRQYRFGTGKMNTEMPAGMVDPGEDPLHAAKRELMEETGYTSDTWRYLGATEANPAFLNNHRHSYLALDVVKTHAPALDESESISVSELSLEEIREAIKSGEMRGTSSLIALSFVFDLRDEFARERF